eukprot:322654_1
MSQSQQPQIIYCQQNQRQYMLVNGMLYPISTPTSSESIPTGINYSNRNDQLPYGNNSSNQSNPYEFASVQTNSCQSYPFQTNPYQSNSYSSNQSQNIHNINCNNNSSHFTPQHNSNNMITQRLSQASNITPHPIQYVKEWTNSSTQMLFTQNDAQKRIRTRNRKSTNPLIIPESFKQFVDDNGQPEYILILNKNNEHNCPKFGPQHIIYNEQCKHHDPFVPHMWCWHTHKLCPIVLKTYVNESIDYTHWIQHLRQQAHEQWTSEQQSIKLSARKQQHKLSQYQNLLPKIKSCPKPRNTRLICHSNEISTRNNELNCIRNKRLIYNSNGNGKGNNKLNYITLPKKPNNFSLQFFNPINFNTFKHLTIPTTNRSNVINIPKLNITKLNNTSPILNNMCAETNFNTVQKAVHLFNVNTPNISSISSNNHNNINNK